MTAAKHALAEGDFKLAARRLVFARDAEPRNTAVLRLMTLAFWQAGDYSRRRRAPCATGSARSASGPAPYRYAARIYEDMGALSQAVDAAEREADARARRRVGLGAPRPAAAARVRPRGRARGARARARRSAPTEQGLLDLALVAQPARRRRRRGLGLRAGDAARAGVAGRLVALRARARAHRPRRATASPPASARSSWPTTPRSATCATRSLAAAPRELAERTAA